MKRRTVLWWGLGAVSALVVGWGALPPASRMRRGDESSSDDLLEPNAWVRIGAVALAVFLIVEFEKWLRFGGERGKNRIPD